MTEPADIYKKSRYKSPNQLDDNILAAAQHQAQLNAAHRFGRKNFMQTVAFASICLVGLGLVLDSKFLQPTDQYAEFASFNNVYEIPAVDAQGSSELEQERLEFDREDRLPEPPALILEEVLISGVDSSDEFATDPIALLNTQEPGLQEIDLDFTVELVSAINDDPILADESPQVSELTTSPRLRDQSPIATSENFTTDIQPSSSIEQVIVTGARMLDLSAPFLDESREESDLLFVDIATLIPEIDIDLRYFGEANFIGTSVDGYLTNRLLLTHEAAEALLEVQQAAEGLGYQLRVFDGYRPQRAVDHFVRWAADIDDQSTKSDYYPNVVKSEFFAQGYIAEQSGHSRGSALDLTLVSLETGLELDMGSPYDFFDPVSWPSSTLVSVQAQQNRQILRSLMIEQGFIPYEAKWWHFTLENEPYPDRYFDFPIE